MSKEVGIALDKDPALQVILAAIQAGAIRFPFSGELSQERILKKIRDRIDRDTSGTPRSALFQSVAAEEVAGEVAGLARLDALYILTIYETLRSGLTEEEAEGIVTATLN